MLPKFRAARKKSAAPQRPPASSTLFQWGNVKKDSQEARKPSKITLKSETQAVVSGASSASHLIALTDYFVPFGCGSNVEGQLKSLSESSKSDTWKVLSPAQSLRGDLKVAQVAVGKDFTAYLTTEGRVYTFGANKFGQLGHSADREAEKPGLPSMVVGIPHDICVKVVCGEYSTYVLTSQGKVFSCGLGLHGRLGTTDIARYRVSPREETRPFVPTEPVFISAILKRQAMEQSKVEGNSFEMKEIKGLLKGANVVALAAGSAHCVAVTMSGYVYGWGKNDQNQLGLKNPEKYDFKSQIDLEGVPTPARLKVRDAQLCAAGGEHTIIVGNSGKKVCAAGKMFNEMMAKGATKGFMRLKLDGFLGKENDKIIKVVCGGDNSAFLSSSGTVFAMGKHMELDNFQTDELGLFTKLADNNYTVTGGKVFDVFCGGDMFFAITSADAKHLLKRTARNELVIRDVFPFQVTAESFGKTPKSLLNGLRRMFYSFNSLNAAFVKRNAKSSKDETVLDTSQVDVAEYLEVMNRIASLNLSETDQLKIRQMVATTLTELDFQAQYSTETDQMRAYFLLFLSPVLQKFAPLEYEVVLMCFFKLPIASRRRFFSWLVNDLAMHNPQKLINFAIRPLVTALDEHISRRKFSKPSVYFCKILNALYMLCMQLNENLSKKVEKYVDAAQQIPSTAFYTKALDDYPEQELIQLLKKWRANVGITQPRVVQTPFGIFPMPLEEVAQGIDPGALKRKPKELRAVEGPTYGLQNFGDLLIRSLDDNLQDTLGEVTPELILFKHPFLLSANMKRKFMHIEDKLEQFSSVMGSPMMLGADPSLTIKVRRGHQMMNDLFTQLAEVRGLDPKDLRKPLRIKFAGEEGLDAGGVRKEFFLLLSAELFSADFAFFKQIGKTNLMWFSESFKPTVYPEKEEISYGEYLDLVAKATKTEGHMNQMETIGIIIGLAMYNDTLLDVQFPPALYKLLLKTFKEDTLSLATFKEFDPESANQLKTVADITDPEELDALELSFEITQEAFGAPKLIEICKNGANMKVSMDNRDRYIAEYIKFRMYSPWIKAQAEALTKGFSAVITAQQTTLKFFQPDELELLMCGTPELDFVVLEEKCNYEGGYEKTNKTVKNFWNVVHNLSYEEKQLFLKFCTGTSRAPAGGLNGITFKVQRAGPDTDHLPTAHTCFNTLMLPDYKSKDKMKRLLMLAIANSEGFGLQ